VSFTPLPLYSPAIETLVPIGQGGVWRGRHGEDKTLNTCRPARSSSELWRLPELPSILIKVFFVFPKYPGRVYIDSLLPPYMLMIFHLIRC
jgi:hypothetical protein